jgi:hypothetical protein
VQGLNKDIPKSGSGSNMIVILERYIKREKDYEKLIQYKKIEAVPLFNKTYTH